MTEEAIMEPAFTMVWDMPNLETFKVPSIEGFVKKYLMKSKVSVDPFARNCRWAEYTNDINPNTAAEFHWDAEDYLKHLAADGVKADLIILDPPYSPRQVKECYDSIGIPVTIEDTQMRTAWKDAILSICTDDAVVLSFGWNTNGLGKERGFEPIEYLIVDHGGNHNATLCLAERRTPNLQLPLL